jgi:hypothetical protein
MSTTALFLPVSTVVKRTKSNSVDKMSQEYKRSVRQKYLRFEMPLTAPAKATNNQG